LLWLANWLFSTFAVLITTHPNAIAGRRDTNATILIGFIFYTPLLELLSRTQTDGDFLKQCFARLTIPRIGIFWVAIIGTE
jgi:hypothetical protein